MAKNFFGTFLTCKSRQFQWYQICHMFFSKISRNSLLLGIFNSKTINFCRFFSNCSHISHPNPTKYKWFVAIHQVIYQPNWPTGTRAIGCTVGQPNSQTAKEVSSWKMLIIIIFLISPWAKRGEWGSENRRSWGVWGVSPPFEGRHHPGRGCARGGRARQVVQPRRSSSLSVCLSVRCASN